MALNTEHLTRCIKTLEMAIKKLGQSPADSIDYDMYRYAAVKGFELALETSGKLLKKVLKPYFATPKQVDQLFFKDVFRQAAKHGLLTLDEVERWFEYRDNRNTTAHDYGEKFANETLKLLPQFVIDVKHLRDQLDHEASAPS